ncbi:flippase [Natribaculum luteum]|uniref:Flippase n=1 Tax=Natribaculum luteum TaxID=1586232 RepID=A0ABD5P4S4_9EURY|nr:flippase [Natribaculum luteum]
MVTREHIVRGFKATLAARAVYMVSSGLLMFVLARYLLEPSAYGSLFWAIGILSIVQLFADFGIGKSASRYFAVYRERDPGQIPHLIQSTIAYKTILLALVAYFLLIFHERIAIALGNPDATPFLAAGIAYIAASSFHGFSQVAFQGFNRLVYSAAVQAIGGVTRLVFAVAFVLLGFGALGAFFGYVVGYAVAAAFGLAVLYYRFYLQYDAAPTFESGLPKRLLEYSVPLAATRSSNVIDKQIDIVLVGYFLSPVAVAFYTLAKQITDFVLAPAASLGFTISPNFGEQKASNQLEQTRVLYQTALTNALLLYVPAAAGLAIVARPFIRLVFGPDYLGAVPVLQIFAVFVVLQAVLNVTTDGLDYLGRARERALAKGVAAISNFGLNVLLIPIVGVVGAAVATVLTHSIYASVSFYVVHAELSLQLEELAASVKRICAITGVMAVAVLLATPLVSDVLWLAGVIGLGAGTWATLAVASGLVDLQEVRTALT